MYALVEIAGKQFKLEENSQVEIPYNNNKVGDKISFDKVLYFDDGTKKTIGNPENNHERKGLTHIGPCRDK